MSFDKTSAFLTTSQDDAWDFADLPGPACVTTPVPPPAPPHDLDALLETALESCRDGVAVLDPDGRIVRHNTRLAELWQIPATLLATQSGRALDAYVARQLVDGSAFLALAGRAAQAGGSARFELHDGRVLERRATPRHLGHRCLGLLVRWRDVTDQLALRDALAASEASRQDLLDTMEDGVFMAVAERFVATNAALPALLGYSEQAFLGLTFDQVIAPEFLALWKHRIACRMPQGDTARRSYRLRLLPRGGDEALWVELQVRRSLHQGERCVLGLVRDVTERRRNEQRAALRDLVLERLATPAALDAVLSAVLLATEDMLPHLRCAVLVRESGATRLRLAATASLPDTLMAALDGLPWADAGCCGLATRRGQALVRDHAEPADGLPAFAHAVAASGLRTSWSAPLLGAGGEQLGVFVAYHDATGAPAVGDLQSLVQAASLATLAIERRQADAQLQLAALVQECATEGVMVLDADFRVLSANPAFLRITGHAANDLLGVDARGFHLLRDGPRFLHALHRALDAGGPWQGEIWSRRRDGQAFCGRVTVRPCLARDGVAQRCIVLLADTTRQQQPEVLALRQTHFDLLTQLPSRELLHQRLQQEIATAGHAGRALALLSVGLDRFKQVNDVHGHASGDQLLIEASRRIVDQLGCDSIVARVAGDEFVAIVHDLADSDAAAALARALQERLARPYAVCGASVAVTASIGVALFPAQAGDASGMLAGADLAMQAAKRSGGNQCSVFTPAQQQAAQQRCSLARDLRAARTEQFALQFQPIVDLRTGRVHKAEALLRWRHPARGMVSPAEFIPLAEETRAIVDIGHWVFAEAARWSRRWREGFDPGFQVSVNKSPVQFDRDGAVGAAWLRQLDALGLAGSGLAIEITEGLLLQSDPHIADTLHAYRRAGIEIAIDDFGTGYSALSYLKKFPIDYLKIDQSFTRNLAPGSSDLALCEAMVVMAHKLGLRVEGEGVETEAQRQLLVDMGCDYGQGYLLGRPMDGQDLERMLTRR